VQAIADSELAEYRSQPVIDLAFSQTDLRPDPRATAAPADQQRGPTLELVGHGAQDLGNRAGQSDSRRVAFRSAPFFFALASRSHFGGRPRRVLPEVSAGSSSETSA
jgi:hypothetical protein